MPEEPPRCRTCRRRLKTSQARARGFGPICWEKHRASLAALPPDDPRRFQSFQTLPLFPEFNDETDRID